jgi:hypothetical protein
MTRRSPRKCLVVLASTTLTSPATRSYSRILGPSRAWKSPKKKQRHDAEDRFRLRSSSDLLQPHRTAGIVASRYLYQRMPYPVIQYFSKSRSADGRWVVMEMHLSLMMPNPGTPPSRPCLNFRWLLCGRVWMRGNFDGGILPR